ncbi:MAG TPA: efflux RND transporter periplasmic adaptor subunit [Vicinamibacteria bacterium]|nr:efflux RND transporter periplasmic adaptor subunit [Vicinamibacteria bacterium]
MNDLKGDLASLRIDRGVVAEPASRKWPWILGLLVVTVLGVIGLLRARGAGVEVEAVTATVSRAGDASAPAAPILTASGYLVARRKAVVSAKIQGRLAELRVEEGSRVKKGELLARLESADYEAQVRRARAAVTRAEADLGEAERQMRLARDLNAQQIVSRDQLESAESRVRVAGAALAQARAEVSFAAAQQENTRILAPFTGTVVKKMAEVGESVAPIPPGVNISTSSGAIVALADLDTLEVEADVSESNVARLGPDQPAEVTVEAFPDRRYRAVLRQIIPTADRTKATVQVKVTILEKDENLRPEMSAKVQFVEAGRPAVAGEAPRRVVSVPAEAVVQRDGGPVVFEVVEGRARARRIATAGERQGKVIVKDGLVGTETLVARPPQTLKDGDAVKVRG